jgi:hypothetical protein
VRTLRWLARKITEDAFVLKEKLSVLASGTDRMVCKAQVATMVQIAALCHGTAEAIEEEQKAKEVPAIVLTDGPVT